MICKGRVESFLWVLALLVSSAWSQTTCTTNTVYLKAPSTWAGLYYNAGGTWTKVPASALQPNGWYKFSLSAIQNPSTSSTFEFGNAPSYYPVNWIGKNASQDGKTPMGGYNLANSQPQAFSCSDFGSGTELYITQDPTDTVKTYFSTAPPNALYFYFIPPDDPTWFQGNVTMLVNGTTKVKMVPDQTLCGYYSVVYFNTTPDTNVIFESDVDSTLQIGLNGVDDVLPVSVNLSTQFTAINPGGTTLYFDADAGATGWSKTDPQVQRQCTYSLAAIIYDQDAALHGAFSCDAYPNVGTSSCPSAATYYGADGKIPCIGVTPHMVQSTLGANRLPVYNPASHCMKDSSMYNSMFRETAGQSVKTCYDLPFTKTPAGLWEFDSYNTPSKAFYPIDNQPNVAGKPGFQRLAYYGVAYSTGTGTLATDGVNSTALTMPLYTAQPSAINWATKDVATGQMLIDLYPADSGEFADGTHPNVYDNTGWNQPSGGTMHNQLFCFESHANFDYHPGQTFYFRGDDDIWVFVNNELAVDLGGMHLAAPGHVNLDTMRLVSGNSYPIDIFFCDRRTNMSDVRISTDIFFQQKTSLYYDQTGNTYTLNKINTGGAGNCAAISTTTTTTTITPGDSLTDLVYRLISTNGTVMDGNPSTAAFDSNLVVGTTYGGINIANGTVTLDTAHLSGLPPGRYKLTIFETSAPGVKVTITFRIAGTTSFWSVNRDTSVTNMTKKPAVDTLVGRLVPFQVANKSGDFVDSTNASFQLNIPNGLLVYQDSLGTIPLLNAQMDSTTSAGRVTLWATGSGKTSADTTTYQVILTGSKSAPIYLKFHHPRLQFVADSSSIAPLGTPKPALGGDTLNFAYINFPTYLMAYDPANGSLCYDCNDTLTVTTVDSLAFSAANGGNVLSLVNGRTEVLVRGTNKVDSGSFVVVGSSPLMAADWSPITLILPPVPVPKDAGMYDKNGDGFADSLHILFDRSIISNDSTPDSLIIRWPSSASDTVIISGKDAVRADSSDGGLGLSIPFSYSEINTSGVGNLDAWFTFTKNGKMIHSALSITIADRMGPVITSAVVKNATKGQQFDTVVVTFSESVDTTGIGASGGLPLEFSVLSTANGMTPHAVPPLYSTWNFKKHTLSLLYFDTSSVQPRMGDSVRIAVLSNYILRDTLGNGRSLLNPLVRIEGDRHIAVVGIPFASFNPSDPAIATRSSKPPTFVQKVSMSDPIDTIKAGLVATDGPVLGFIIQNDLASYYLDSTTQANYTKKNPGKTLSKSDVVLHYRVDYFTSLGGFVAEGKGDISCTDSLFSKDCTGPADGYVFVGWNLTSNKGRLVGTGAYVARLSTWATIATLGAVSGTSMNVDQTWGVLRSNKGSGLLK